MTQIPNLWAYYFSMFIYNGISHEEITFDDLGTLFDSLTYDSNTKTYRNKDIHFAFTDKKVTSFGINGDKEYFLSDDFEVSDIGTTTVEIPAAAQAQMGYHTITFYAEDGTTVFDTEPVADGAGVPELNDYPHKADKDADTMMIFDKWVIVGEGDMTAITQDIAVKPTFKEVAYTTLFDHTSTRATLKMLSYNWNEPDPKKYYGLVTLPESWGVTYLYINGSLAYYPNMTLVLSSTVRDVSGVKGNEWSRITLNSHFAYTDHLLMDENKLKIYGYDDDLPAAVTKVPSTTVVIGDFAFAYAPISSIALPEGLTTISQEAFYYCENLTALTLPSTIDTIDWEAFGHSGLTSFSWPSGIPEIPGQCFTYCEKLREITLPSGLTTIGTYAFQGDTALTTITLPSTLTTLEDYCFESSGLTAITLPNVADILSATAIFDGCSSLASIAIPDAVTSIGESCFSEDTALASVTFGTASQLTTINEAAFNMSGLTSLTLPANLTTLGDRTFQECLSLASANLSACTKLTTLPNECFDGDISLTQLTLADEIVGLSYHFLANT